MNLEEKVKELVLVLQADEAELLSIASEAYNKAKAQAMEQGTQKALKGAEGTKRHLEALIRKYSKEPEEAFKTLKAVHKYLKTAGYKVSERTLYNHIELKYFSDKNGIYHRRDVDEYAESYLTKTEDSNFADEKLKAEIKQKQLRSDMIAVDLAQKRGELIDRAIVGREFAARIVALRQALSDVFTSLPLLMDGKTITEQRAILKEKETYILASYARRLECLK